MKVDAQKEKARKFELKEDWQKALDLYREALQMQDEDEPPDITLYNRVGDIQTRLGKIDGAVESYEKAIELYLEAELPNNAIAICKKVLRNLPDRSVFFLRMGQIRGAQGFLTDARQNFLTYAEHLTAAGDMNAALDALVEFVALAPEDLEIRLGLASQLEAQGRKEDATHQYSEGYRRLVLQNRDEEAQAIGEKVRELAPDVMLPDPQSIRAGGAAHSSDDLADAPGGLGGLAGLELGSGIQEDVPGVVEVEAEFGEIEIAGEKDEEVQPPVVEPVAASEEEFGGFEIGGGLGGEEAVEEEEEAVALPTFGFDGEGEEEEEAVALPTFGFDDEGGEEEEAVALPTFGFDDEAEDEEEPVALPTLGFGDEDVAEAEEVEAAEEVPAALEDAMEDAVFEAAVELPEVVQAPAVVRLPADHAEAAQIGDLDLAMEMLRAQIASRPDEVELYQRLVEYAFRKADHAVLIPAYMELASCLARTRVLAKAKAIYQQVLSLSPGHPEAQEGLLALEGAPTRAPTQVVSSEEYVDLGSMILGEEGEKTTRWQVTSDAPSGDDQADFAKMLSQFKQKVSEHVDADDVAAHHDLGTAYMEMGLLDEAISEFQMALRASPDHLPTHEVMGRCWMEMKKPDMAVRALTRALEIKTDVEDEFIGIYYLMGRAQEDLGNTLEAVEFYDRVFSLDINFVDVTERLRALRKDDESLSE